MKIFVIHGPKTGKSGRELGEYLKKILVGKAEVSFGPISSYNEALKKGSFDYIVNVGNYEKIDLGKAKILNNPSAIGKSSNKRDARAEFSKSDVPAPKLWLDGHQIKAADLPIIARTTHHTKGRGLWVCKNMAELAEAMSPSPKRRKVKVRTRKGNIVWRVREAEQEPASHFIKFIPNTREFRVHVISPTIDINDMSLDDYLVIKLSEKTAGPEGVSNNIIKSHDNGWIFSYPPDRKDPSLEKVRDAARKAIHVLGLHWGAVDVMMSKDDGKIYVLEVNSSPSLTDDNSNTLEKYGEAFKSLIGVGPPLAKKEKKSAPKTVSYSKQDKKSALKKLLDRARI